MSNILIHQNETVFKILTKREWQIVTLIYEGYRTKEIAEKFNIKLNTVSTIKKNSYLKLSIKNNVELYKLFLKQGVGNLDS